MTGDDFTLIELHKMAAECGDGLIPEMLDALRLSGDALAADSDLVQVPERQNDIGAMTRAVSHENNVIAFPGARRRVVIKR